MSDNGKRSMLSRKYRKRQRLNHTRSNGRPPGTKNQEGHSAGAPKGNINHFKHGLSLIERKRREHRLPRGRDKRFKLELLTELIADAGGASEITATKRLHAEIIATDATFLGQMDRAIQRIFRLNPKYKENPAALAKLDAYRRPVINSLSANLDRFGFIREPPKQKTLAEILEESESDKPEDQP
jgi:hypothetical protein